MDLLIRFDLIFPYSVPPLLGIIVCLFLASLTIKQGSVRKENRFFTLICLIQAIYSLDLFLRTILVPSHLVLGMMRLSNLILVFLPPLTIQFIHSVLRISNRRWLEGILYLITFGILFQTQGESYIEGVQKHFFGYHSISGNYLKFYGCLAILLIIYGLIILVSHAQKEKNFIRKLKLHLIFWGFSINAILIVGNLLPGMGYNIYPPGNFSFLPMGVIAYGVLQHRILDATRSWVSEGYIIPFLVGLVWSPLVFAILFWFFANDGIFYPNLLQRITLYTIPPILSMFVCFGLATICCLTGVRKTETIVFAFICMLWGGLSLDKTLGTLLKDTDMILQIARIDHFFLVLLLGLYGHFLQHFSGFPRKGVYLLYTISGVFMSLTHTKYYYHGVQKFYWGYSVQAGIAFRIFGLIAFLLILWGSWHLIRVARKQPDVASRKQYYYFLIGGGFTAILNLGNIPSSMGISFYPLGHFTFIPVLIMAYGVFRHDIIRINIYTKKQIVSYTVKTLLYLGYSIWIPPCLWVLKDIDLEYFYIMVVPYGIPSLLSFLVCLFLSVLALQLGKNQKEYLLFSLICLLYSLLNLDIILNMLIVDLDIGLQLNRWDHFFFVFSTGFNLHMFYLVVGEKKRWWIVYLAYLLGFIMAPLTQTEYYFSGMYQYYWGYFAKKSILFDLQSMIWVVGVFYCIIISYQAYQRTINPFQKHRILLTIISLFLVAILTMGNLPAIHGIPIYPVGNFIFIPFLLFAYGFFKYNLKDALNIIQSLLFWGGLLWIVWILAIAEQQFFSSQISILTYFSTVLGIIFLYTAAKKSWHSILNLFFDYQRTNLKKNFEKLINRLSKQHNTYDIYQTLKNPFMDVLVCSRFSMFSSTDKQTLEGWETFYSQHNFFIGEELVVREKPCTIKNQHPLLPLFLKARTLIHPEMLEEWILVQGLQLSQNEPLQNFELIQPVFYEGRLTCLLGFGRKMDGSNYSSDERNFIRQLGLTLGPYLENAKLMNSLEKKVEQRTSELKKALEITEEKEREIVKVGQIVYKVNSTLNLDEVMETVTEALQPILPFNQIGIQRLDAQENALLFHKIYSEVLTQEQLEQLFRLKFSIHDDQESYFVRTSQERTSFFRTFHSDKLPKNLAEKDLFF